MSSVRETLHETIQATAAADDNLADSVLLGFLVVGEWQAPDGDRWLSKVSGDASGRELSPWRERGFGHEVANLWWPNDGGDEDD